MLKYETKPVTIHYANRCNKKKNIAMSLLSVHLDFHLQQL